MELHVRETGAGPPVVLLHGLFGSNENLGGLARALAGRYRVIGMDLRNHGRSPHAPTMTYPEMAADVAETMDAHGLEHAAVLGHSLGGKTAMQLALDRPERVDALIPVDIAPVAHRHSHYPEIDVMRGLDLAAVQSRDDAALAGQLPDPHLRQFLLKNLERTRDGFAWRIPLDTIAAELDAVAAAPAGEGSYTGPTLFIRGSRSDYLPFSVEPLIRERFPGARIATIADAGHWPHIDAPVTFAGLVEEFVDKKD